MSGPSRPNSMRRSAANVARPPSGPRPSHSSSNIRGYLSAARSAQNTVPPSPSPSVQSTSARGRATSPTLKRKDRDFDPPNDDDYETNITVVVRCRGRNAREIAENSGVVLSTPGGLRGREVVMNTGTATGGNRTYTFDRVLPPESDQSMVYDDVVQPILTEMLSGYNCTIFAYGQTGTGKTYTMTGDMKQVHGTYSDTAGIIPRALHSLFSTLDNEGAEYTVKCSFLELYNEELRDLLSLDEAVKVKIFDDSTRKGGIVIQNMEESYIKSAEEGSKLLVNGSIKRQVAATKCNDLSSRSHTVFSITVHVKEPGEDGEDILRTGKLNLVDLAGSENIGRSGAENKRAREAGMINQSLLTLGRVINALVDKAQHIPYRESKLTRLLQDSLGGRTKTCIIATVSPARINLEETMSTLDYATRAKNIKNKPQVNQLMTKKALLKEYVQEIERLKIDLLAARQKNGIFLPEESWKVITEESESRKLQIEEQGRKIEVLNIRYEKTMDDHRRKMKLFEDCKIALAEAKEDLDHTKTTLEAKTQELADTQQVVLEETTLRKAHQKTEARLDVIGHGLIKTVEETLSDIAKLQDKIDRKQGLDVQNKQVWSDSQSHVQDVTQLVQSKIDEFTDQHASLTDSLSSKISEFLQAEAQKLSNTYETVQRSLDSFTDREEELQTETEKGKNEMNEVLEGIKGLREDVKERVGEGLRGLNDAAERIAAEVIAELCVFQEALHESYSNLGREFKVMFDNTQKHMVAQQAEAERLRVELSVATSKAITSNATASTSLETILADERERSAAERQNLIIQMTALLNTSAEEQERRLNKRITQVRDDISMSTQELSESSGEYNQRMTQWSAKEEGFMTELITSRESLKTRLVQDWQHAEEYSSNIQNTTQSIHAQTVKLVDEQIQEVDVKMRVLDGFVTRARTENEGHHERFTATFNNLSKTAKDSYDSLSTDVSEMQCGVEVFGQEMVICTEDIKSSIEPFTAAAQKPLAELRVDIAAANFSEYVSTAQTPRRRKYAYPNKLPRTEPHEEILANLSKDKDRRARFGFSPTKVGAISQTTPSPVDVEFSTGGGDGNQAAAGVVAVGDVQGVNSGPTVATSSLSGTADTVTAAFTTAASSAADPSLESSSPLSPLTPSSPLLTPTPTDTEPSSSTTGPSSDIPPLINSSINTHTFVHPRRHPARYKQTSTSTTTASSAITGGLKELNPNVKTFRTSITPPAHQLSKTGGSLDYQPPLKKQTVEKMFGVGREGGNGGKKARSGRGRVGGENSVPGVRSLRRGQS